MTNLNLIQTKTKACFIYFNREISVMGRTEISISTLHYRNFCTLHYRNLKPHFFTKFENIYQVFSNFFVTFLNPIWNVPQYRGWNCGNLFVAQEFLISELFEIIGYELLIKNDSIISNCFKIFIHKDWLLD